MCFPSEKATMSLREKLKDQYVFQKENKKWSFYDEYNKPIGVEYDSIEKAIDALYKYFELSKEKENVQYS